MKALIEPQTSVCSGYRVAQVVPDDAVFPVAEPLFWTFCPDNTVSDQFWYDPITESVIPIPVIQQPIQPATDQAVVSGAQTL